MKQQLCGRGHDLSVVGKNAGGCRACGVIRARKWSRKNPEQSIGYHEKRPWLKHYSSAHKRVYHSDTQGPSYKGIPFTLTSEQVKELWFRDKAYLMEEPSIDRKISKLGYTFENCQFLELRDNRKKH